MAKERSSPEGKTVLLQGIMASGNPVVLADLKGRISFANPACEHLLGYRREELLGESLSILYSAETQGRFRRILQEAKAKGFGQGELELVKRDGTRIDGQVSMTLLQDGSGYEEIIVINRDISELMTLRKELKQQAEELAVRDELLHILGRSLDLEAGLEEALERVLRLVGFQIGGIALVDRERGVLVPKVHRGIPTAILRDLEREPFQLDEGLSGVAMERREPLVIEDLARDPRVTRRTLKESGLRMVIIVPLLAQERIVGFLYLLSKRPLEIPPERLRLLQAAGDQMGAAVENFQLFLKEQRRLSQLFLMGEIARKASSILDLERLLDEAAAEIQRTFNYHDVLIFFADQERRELVRKAWAGYYRRQGPKEERIPITDQGILSWVVRHGQTALVNDVRCDPRYEALFPQTRAELCVPLKREGRVIGGINVESIQANAFDETDAAVLEALADQLVVAISN
ncbi:MAG TPA: GAF domain-containing protein, partial [Candidatus Latescibacteria bacterium]|nr:GAF domain-containing protein [Candidatus Latescibacterota bacterium]